MSLLPTKHSHPDKTTIAVSMLLLKRLKRTRIDKYDSLTEFLQKKDKAFKELFLSAVNFLFLMGLIRYHKKSDTFEYTGL